MMSTTHLVHVGIKAPQDVKAKWEAEAEAQGRSLSNYLFCKIEKPELFPSAPDFRKPIHGVPGKKVRKDSKVA